jgi:hypothetical protein
LIAHRTTGDTLAISDSVAMTPTVHPAAAGTQRSREVDRLRGRDAVSVTDREDIRSSYGMPMSGTCRRLDRLGVVALARREAATSTAGSPSDASALLDLPARPSQAKAGDSKWSPTPTVGHKIVSRLSGPVIGTPAVPVLHSAGGCCRDRSAPGPA